MSQGRALITLVVPVFNEAAGLSQNLPWLLEQAATDGVDFEVLLIDDGSTDQTAKVLEGLASQDPRIRVLSLVRNFGKEAAIAAGLDHARGAAVIVLDSDRQHPPQMIAQMIERWRQGFAVVEAIKRDRGPQDRAAVFLPGSFTGCFPERRASTWPTRPTSSCSIARSSNI